jgi:hypothetical protein
MGLAKPCETCRLLGTGQDLARQESVGQVLDGSGTEPNRFWGRNPARTRC